MTFHKETPGRLLPYFVYAISTVVFTWPLASNIGGLISNYDDSFTHAWTLAWGWHCLSTFNLDVFNANIFYPFPKTLASIDHLFGVLPFSIPARILGGGPIAAHNFAVMAGMFLSASAMFAVMKKWTGDRLAAFVAGFVYAFNPAMLRQVNEVHIIHAEFLPVMLYFFDDFVLNKNKRSLLLFMAAFAWNSLMAFYIAYIGALIVMIRSIHLLAVERSKIVNRTTIAGGISFFAFLGLFFAVFFMPYMEFWGGQGGVSRPLDMAILSSPLAPDDYIDRTGMGADVGAVLPLLSVPILIAAMRLLSDRSRRLLIWGGAIFCIIGAAMSLGPYVKTVAGPGSIPMPYRWLLNVIPFFSAFRDPKYFMIMAWFGAAMLIGGATGGIAREWKISAKHRAVGAAVFIVAAGLDFFSLRPGFLGIVEWDKRPEYYRALELGGSNEPRVEIPVDANMGFPLSCVYMMYSSGNPAPLAQACAVSRPPEGWGYVQEKLADLPSDDSIKLLGILGIERLAVHSDPLCEYRGKSLVDIFTDPQPLGFGAKLIEKNDTTIALSLPHVKNKTFKLVGSEYDLGTASSIGNPKAMIRLLKNAGISEIALLNNHQELPPGVIYIESLSNAAPNGEPPDKCAKAFTCAETSEDACYLRLDRFLTMMEACDDAEILGLMAAVKRDRIATKLYEEINPVEPFDGYTQEELAAKGLRLENKYPGVDVYRVTSDVTFTSDPLAAECLPERRVDSGNSIVAITLKYKPSGALPWKNKHPGMPSRIECKISDSSGALLKTGEIEFFPPPAIMETESFLTRKVEWMVEGARGGDYIIECSGADIVSCETRAAVIP